MSAVQHKPEPLDHLPIERTVRPQRHGSDYFGPCDHCGKHMSQAFAVHTARVLPDGTRITPNLGSFGHEACVRAAIAQSTHPQEARS